MESQELKKKGEQDIKNCILELHYLQEGLEGNNNGKKNN